MSVSAADDPVLLDALPTKGTAMNLRYYFVFDVESIGLHGEGFAVAWVVITAKGEEVHSSIQSCPQQHAAGTPEDRKWIQENVTPHLPPVNCSDPVMVRGRFWLSWLTWKEKGAIMAADVAWPVEARFLNACIDEDRIGSGWDGPYPLIDIASVRFARGLDPLGTEDRLPLELPAHNPLGDARQSARLLVEALSR